MGDHERLRHSCQKGQMLLFKPGDLLFGKGGGADSTAGPDPAVPAVPGECEIQIKASRLFHRKQSFGFLRHLRHDSFHMGARPLGIVFQYQLLAPARDFALSRQPGHEQDTKVSVVLQQSVYLFENLRFIKVHEALAGQNRIKGMIREIHTLRRTDHIIDVQSRFLRQSARLPDLIL